MQVKILGTGCPNCRRLEKVTRQALEEMGTKAEITKVTDMMQILSYNIPATPGLVVNEKVVSHGRVPRTEEIKMLIADAASAADA